MQPAQVEEPIGKYDFKEVSGLMEKALSESVFPGAVLVVGKNGRLLHQKSYGFMTTKPAKDTTSAPMNSGTVFDIAGLTNVVVTTTLCMKLVEEGKIRLEDRVSRYIQGFGVHGKSSITIGHLLTHTSGLPAWHPYFEELMRQNAGSRLGILTTRGARDFVFNAINRTALKYEPGSKQIYSDVGFILLGEIAEVVTGLPLDKAAFKYIFQPLSMRSTSYIDLALLKRRGIQPVTDLIAPTEDCPWRKRVLCGEVHDDNAWAMGGISGHSGIFMSAGDLHILASALILSSQGRSDFLTADTVNTFWQGTPELPRDGYKFGWDSPSRENGLGNSDLSARAVGHCGFTGCSIWIEPDSGLDVILFSNRINPTRNNKKIFAFRQEIHNAVLDAVNKA
jgi:serine-type D-Ala-D-Ala carboxypeptidase